MKEKILAGLVGVCVCFGVYGQTVLENNPTGLKWEQVNTPHFRVLFPKGFEQPAQRVANTLETIYEPESKTLGRTPRKISVVLQNQSSTSNGFVSMIPRRSEFYTMPAQDYNFIGTNDWLDLLSAHEYRHVVQYRHATRGINRLIYYVFGPTTLVGMAHAAVPQWFWEGDAVAAETAFTPSGRGRLPRFGLVFKTNLLEGRTFNYHKQYLRSYKHYIPDHYVLGYHMVGYLRNKTQDPEIWSKVTAHAWGVPIEPFTFSNSLRRQTGSYVLDVYKEMAASLSKEWKDQIDKTNLTAFEKVNERKSSAYTDFLYPQVMEDGSVIAMKKGIGDIEQFISIKDGSQDRVFVPGYINDAGMLSATAGKISWSEYGYDTRWRVKTFSKVKVFDLRSKKTTVIGSRRDRLAAAALSPDGTRIAAIRSDNSYKHTLVILEVKTGKQLLTLPNPENVLFSMPRWSNDGKSITVLKTTRAGRTVSEIDVSAGGITDLLPMTSENIGHALRWNQYLIFGSPVNGVDNVFSYEISTGKRFQVTASKYGAYSPTVSPDGKWLYYSDQTRDGLDVVRVAFDPSSWRPMDARPEPQLSSIASNLIKQEGREKLWDSIPATSRPVKRYHPVSGIFNPYSWGAYVSNDLTQINAGISTRDILSTTSLSAGYFYDIDEKTSGWRGDISYQGLYPIVDLSVTSSDRKNDEKAFGNSIDFEWKEVTAEGGLRIPLLLTNSKFNRSLAFGNFVGFTRTSSFENTVTRNGTVIYKGPERITPAFDTLVFLYKDQLNNGDLVYNRFNLSFYNLLKRSYRDFLYRWGQTLDFDLYNTPYSGDFNGRLFAVRSTLYFPGVARHHVLYTRFAYQESLQAIETNTYTFRNRIPKPRGHSYPDDGTFLSLSANYAMPVWYPDLAMGPILNIQRVKANFFYDYGKGTGKVYYYKPQSDRVYYSTNDQIYQSVGLETTFDFNVFRLLPKFELGVRTTYRFANDFNSSGMVVEFLVGNIGF